jgi:polyisoprenyl-phosphate glycosyltransferase
MPDPSEAIELSLVVPVFNEEDCLPEFHRRAATVLSAISARSEIVYVDDGSGDGSPAILRRLAAEDPSTRVLTFSRNFGHQVAISAGLDHAEGEAVVVIDSDLQDPPEVIPELVERWRQGADVVHAVRSEREGETRFKRWTAGLFYRVIRRWTDLEIEPDAGDFRLYGRRTVEVLRTMRERNRFIRGMTAWVGFDQARVLYVRRPRFAGGSKYPVRKMLALAGNAITGFSMVPLQLASILGFLVSVLAVLTIPIVIVLRVVGVEGLGGQTTVLLAVLFFGGVQLMFLGVIGEYLGRMALDVKLRPLYVLRDDTGPTRPSRPSDLDVGA